MDNKSRFSWRSLWRFILIVTLVTPAGLFANITTNVVTSPLQPATSPFTPPPALASPGAWTSEGPYGGNIQALAFSPGFAQDRTVFAATTQGVFKSTTSGDNWFKISQGLSAYAAVLAVTPNYTQSQTLFAGTQSSGVFKSTDGGRSWAAVNTGLGNLTIKSLTVAPTYAMTPTLLAGTGEGLYRSDDGGASWIDRGQWGYDDKDVAVNALAFSPGYAGDQTIWAATSAGLFRSRQDGVDWPVPGQRESHSAIYDAAHNRMIVFGGYEDTYEAPPNYFDDVWTLELTPGAEAWTQLNPAGMGPAARSGHTAIYDAANSRMIVFGGYDYINDVDHYFNDVWALELTPGAETWTQLSPGGTGPAARHYHTAIYDAAHSRMIAFGGRDGASSAFNDVWALDLSTPGAETWTPLSPAGTEPAARSDHTAIYDTAHSRMIVFGGGSYQGDPITNTWALDLSTPGAEAWTPLSPAGTPACGHAAIYDAAHGRMIVFGRCPDPRFIFPDYPSDNAWALDLAVGAEAWTPLSLDKGGAGSRSGSTTIYDAANGRMIVFGGSCSDKYSTHYLNDVWSLGLSIPGAEVWAPLNPGGAPPAARHNHTAIYDAANGRMIVFGGWGAGHLNDAWALDLSTPGPEAWTQLSPTGTSPLGRHSHTAVYDAAHNRMIIFGGLGGPDWEPNVYSDVWALDLSTPGEEAWTQISPAGTEPVARYNHTAIYDAPHSRMIVFGGQNGPDWELNVYSDVWALDLSAPGEEAWTQLSPAGTPPTARLDHTAIYDAAHGRMVVFGGHGTDGELFDNVWGLDLSTPGTEAWAQLNPAGTPPQAASNHVAIYDAAHGRMIVNGNWALDLTTPEAEAWTQFSPTLLDGESFDAFYDHAAIYDAAHGRMIVFGGQAGAGWMDAHDDMWALELGTPGMEALHIFPHVRGMALSPSYPSDGTLFAATPVDLLKSTDDGASWVSISSGLPTGVAVRAVALSPGYPSDRLIFAGTSSGVYRSADGGATWQAANNGLSASGIQALALSPAYQQDQILFTGTDESIYRSLNGGLGWTAANVDLGAVNVRRVAASPGYISDRTLFAAGDNGLYKSTNAGASWTAVNNGVTTRQAYDLALSPGYPSNPTLFAATAEGVFRSGDGGGMWARFSNGLPDGTVGSLAMSPQYVADQTLFASMINGGEVHRSTDGGGHWGRAELAGLEINTMALSPVFGADSMAWGATDEGLFTSADGGDSWHGWPLARQGHTAIYDAAHDRMVVFGGMTYQYAGTYTYSYLDVWALDLSAPGAKLWTRLSPAGAPPAARYSHTAIYDAAHNRMIIFGGGNGASDLFNDVWALDLSTPGAEVWMQLNPAGAGPAARLGHIAIYDATHGRMIVFGGGTYDDINGPQDLNDVWALQLTPGTETWTQLNPAGAGPVAHSGYTAIYDAAHSRMIVFGGYIHNGTSNDVWVLDLSAPGAETWTQLSPAGTPPRSRGNHTAIYDATHGRMIVFGGYYTNDTVHDHLNDVWVLGLTPGAEAWTQLNPAGEGPTARGGHTAIYDATHDRMVVFGGGSATQDAIYDAWGLDLGTPGAEVWTLLNQAGMPRSTYDGHTTIYDTAHNRMIVFWAPANEVWALELTPGPEVWAQLNPAGTPPAARRDHTAIYDAAHDRMVVFGGLVQNDTGGSDYSNDVWALNLTPGAEAWTQLSPAGAGPAARGRHTAIYDANHARMVVFGGDEYGDYYSDVWVLDLSTPGAEAWSQLSPAGTPPAVRIGYTVIYDAARGRMIVFGGNATGDCLNAVWALDLTPGSEAWSQLNPAGTPPGARYIHTAIYDAAHDRMIVFGGSYDSHTPLNDVWALELTPGAEAWTQLSPAGAGPAARFGHTAIYDAAHDRMVIFGGSVFDAYAGSQYFNDVWALGLSTPGAETWAPISTVHYFIGQGVNSLAVSPNFSADRTLLLASEDLVYRSLDGGTIWTAISALAGLSDLLLSPAYASDQTLYALANGDVYQSTDEGFTWAILSDGLGANSLTIAPEGATWTLYAAAPNGVWSYTIPHVETVRTLILTNQARLAARYGQEPADELLQTLYSLAEHPQVQGLVVDLGQAAKFPQLAADYAAWDASMAGPVSSNSTHLANTVAQQIRQVVLDHTTSFSNTHYLVLVGNDEIIPFHRLPDGTADHARPYGDYAPITGTVAIALADRMTLSDDPYANSHAIALPSGRTLYVPHLSAGRLVESPQEMMATLDTFMLSDQINEHSLAFVSGADDYLMDSAYAISATLRSAKLNTSALIGNQWTAADLDTRFLQKDNDLVSLNQHAYHDKLLAPDDSFISPQQVIDASGKLERSLVYATGCHAGLSLPDEPNGGPTSTLGLDFPQAFARRGASFVANTGYGWGTLYAIGLSERLLLYYSQELAPAPGSSTTIGQALRDAKRHYYLNARRFDEYDEKVLNELTLYGLPMYRIATPAGAAAEMQNVERGTTIAGHQPTTATITYTVPGTQTLTHLEDYVSRATFGESLDVHHTTQTEHTLSAIRNLPSSLPPFVTKADIRFQFPKENFEISEVGHARYYSYLGEVQANRGMPLLPRFSFGVSIPGARTQGVIFAGGVYSDVVAPAITTTVIISDSGRLDTSSGNVPEQWYPTVLELINQIEDGGDDQLTTSLAKMRGSVGPDGQSVTPTQRLYNDVSFEVYYYNRLGGVPDRTPPQVSQVQVNLADQQVRVSAAVTDVLGVGDARALGVWRVVVAYTPDTPGQGQWGSLELSQDALTGQWIGQLPKAAGTQPLLLVQAVDRGGNVTADDHGGWYYTVPVPRSYLPLVLRNG